MNWYVRFGQEVNRRHPGAAVWYARVNRQPGWVVKTAGIVALMVVVVPVVLLTFAAVLVGVTCLFVLSLVAAVARAIARIFTPGSPGSPGSVKARDDGRRNVRVIDRP